MAVCTLKNSPTSCKSCQGFTLIEVLLALAIIAIALTALLKATSQNIEDTHRIQEANSLHWVAMQAVAMVQLHTVLVTPQSTQVTTFLGQPIYWRVKITPTTVKGMQQMIVSVSTKQSGPFRDELTAFRYMG
jgi:general secretion pathway protein I